MQRTARTRHVRSAADHLVLAREAECQLSGRRRNFAFELGERCVEVIDVVVRVPDVGADDFEPHAAEFFEDSGRSFDAPTQAPFPMRATRGCEA